jgi:nicotinamidase-related amidase
MDAPMITLSTAIDGIATNMGAESTARVAHDHGYAVVLAEDAATGLSAEMHAFAYDHVFPHLGWVAKVDEIEL